MQSTRGASRLSRILIPAPHIVLNVPHYAFDCARARGANRPLARSRNARRHTTDARIMSDSEHEVETFESADAGASHTVPMQAGSVRKGGFMVRRHRSGARARDATASASVVS